MRSVYCTAQAIVACSGALPVEPGWCNASSLGRYARRVLVRRAPPVATPRRTARAPPPDRPLPMLSQLALSINESPTLKLNETAALLRDKGEPVIHLGGGEPKSRAPIDAIISCTSLLNTGEVRYTAGRRHPGAKKAIIRYTEEHYDRAVKPENVIVSSGAKQSIMVALHAILDPKDEVIFPAPYWVSYPEMVKLAGGVPVPVTAARRLVRAHDRGHRAGGRLVHEGDHPQQPEQPERRDVHRGVRRGGGRALRAQGHLAAHGRHLQPPGVRRPHADQLLRVHEGGRRAARSSSSSTACRRCTR